MSLSLRDASLMLLDSTDGFIDLLSPARLTGKLTAGLDRKQSQRMAWALNQIVTNALGYTRLVEKETRSLFPNRATRRRRPSSSSSSGA